MKIHRFLLNKNNIKQPLGEELTIKEKEILHQWNNVLKFKKTENIILFDGISNIDYLYKIKDITNKVCILEFCEKIENISQKDENNSHLDIILCISLIKKEKMSILIEKCTEIGVDRFISLVSDRTEKKNINSFNIKKMNKIAEEATEQSGRNVLPIVEEPVKMIDLIKDLENKKELDKIVVLHTDNSINNLNLDKKDYKYIFIGPEGGWSEKEIDLFKEKGIRFINFGNNVLRAETAAIVSSFFFINQNK